MRIEILYYPCYNPEECDSPQYSQLILPPKHHQLLGKYERLHTPPVEFACFRMGCGQIYRHDEPALSKTEELEKLLRDLRSQSLWSIKIKNSDLHYADRELIYTVAPTFTSQEQWVDFVNRVRPPLKNDPYVVTSAGVWIPTEDVITQRQFEYGCWPEFL